MKNMRVIAKDCAISTGITVILIAFLETSFRISRFIFYRLRSPNQNHEEEVYRDKFIAFDKAVPISDLKARQIEVGGPLIYKPWIQIGNRDLEGEFGNVVNGTRVVIDNETLKDCGSEKEIWMFGGSTTYGVGVPYSENIPSFLQQILNKYNSCFKVINYGVPHHYSKQETIHFVNNLLDQDKTPKAAIFLDGLNDFGQPGATLRGEPHFTPALTSMVEKIVNTSQMTKTPILNLEIISYLRRKILKKSPLGEAQYINYQLPSNYTEEQAAKKISELFIKNSRELGKICEAYLVQCFRFLQPVAAVDYSPPANDALTTWVQDEKKTSRFKIGYSLIRQNLDKEILGLSLVDISKLLEDYNGIPYIDGGHYSPRANSLIAESIYSAIAPEIILR